MSIVYFFLGIGVLVLINILDSEFGVMVAALSLILLAINRQTQLLEVFNGG